MRARWLLFFDRAERHHRWVAERFDELDAPLLVCEPVLAEVMYLLARYPKAQDAVLELVENGALSVAFRIDEHIDALRSLLQNGEAVGTVYQMESALVSYRNSESLKEWAMAANMALKRARKAQRRKQVVAQKRQAEVLETSLPARVLRAADAPIRHCMLTEAIFDVGMGTLVLARGATPDHIAFSAFLIDVFCLGIKDVMFETVEREVFERYMDATDARSPLVSVDPSYARKLLRDLVAWSQSIGFAPHRDLAAVEPVFGDVSADASDAVFRFGRDGKPVYIPGPTDTAPLIQRRIAQLQKCLGDGGFEYETAA